MTIQCQEVDVAAERGVLVPFLESYLSAHRTPGYYEWRYLDNPAGRGRAWIARWEGSPGLVGVAAAFPRRMHVKGGETTCWNLGDFAIREDCRSLGPAVALQRACLADVLAGSVPFAYDHPSCSMMAVYRRLGIAAIGEVVRFAKPLRIDHRMNILPRPIGRVGNVIVSLADNWRTRRLSRDASRTMERFDQRAAALDRAVANTRRVVGARTPEYLNWRYLDNPHGTYAVVERGDDTTLGGFAIVRRDDEYATLCDFASDGNPATDDALLSESVALARGWGARTLNAPVLESSPLIPLLDRWGFRRRDAAAFVVLTKRNGSLDGLVTDAGAWYHTDGDRDV